MNVTSGNIKNEIRENFYLSSPLIASWLIYSMSGFIGTAMVARLGANALAASVVIGGIWTVLTVFFFGVFNAVSVLVSHQYGAKNYLMIGHIVRHAFWVGLILCVPIMLLLRYSPQLFYWVMPSNEVLELATVYARTLMWSTPSIIILIIIEHMFNGVGKTKISFWISLLEVPFEILLIYIFMFGKLGFPAMGIAGVGYGFTAAFTLTLLGVLIFLFRTQFVKPFQLFSQWTNVDKRYFHEILRIGLPVGLMYLVEVSALTVATFLMAQFGTLTLAAQQIAMQYLAVTVNIPYAMGQAVSIRIGQSAGRRDLTGIYYASYVGMVLSTLGMLLVAFIYFAFPHWLLSVDLDLSNPANTPLINKASAFLVIVGLFQLCDSFRVMEAGVLRALKDTKFALYISLFSFWAVGLLCAWIFGFILRWDGQGIWLGMTLGVIFGAVILFFRMRYMLARIDIAKLIKV